MMSTGAFLCIILALHSCHSCLDVKFNCETDLILKYAKLYMGPTKVTYFTCRNKYEILESARILNEEMGFSILTDFTKIAKLNYAQHRLIVTNSDCNNFDYLMKASDKLNLFQSPLRWLILQNDDKITFPTNILSDSNFAIATKRDNHFQLQLIYKYRVNDNTYFSNDLGTYSLNENSINNHKFTIGRNRSDLKGSPITTSYLLLDPESNNYFFNHRHRHIDSISKASYVMVYYVLEMINCTTKFIRRNSWGYRYPNSSYYEGMIGDLQNGTADIGGTTALYYLDRLDVVEYIGVTTPSALRFVFRAPPLTYVENLLTLSFDVNVWYCCCFTTVAAIGILYIIVQSESKIANSVSSRNNVNSIKPKLSDVVMVQVGAISQQGSDTEPKTASGRMAALIVFLSLMFLYTAYSANIIVLLQSTSKSIKSVQDLLQSKIALGVEDMIYNKFFFGVQREPVRRAIYETKIAPVGQKSSFWSLEEGIGKVRDEFFALHIETTRGYKIIMDTFQEHEKCGLMEIDYLNMLWPSFVMRKRSPYAEIFKVSFRKLCESGIGQREINVFYFKKPKCTSNGNSFISIGINDAYFAFVIFSYGIGLSLIFLVSEKLFDTFSKKSEINP